LRFDGDYDMLCSITSIVCDQFYQAFYGHKSVTYCHNYGSKSPRTSPVPLHSFQLLILYRYLVYQQCTFESSRNQKEWTSAGDSRGNHENYLVADPTLCIPGWSVQDVYNASMARQVFTYRKPAAESAQFISNLQGTTPHQQHIP
jgi:hypothetical protein